MTSFHTHKWSHVSDLPEDWRSLVSVELANYVKQWKDEVKTLQNTEAYEKFQIELRRQWAVETGILERLYDITEGASRTLIEKGFDAAMLAREDTDQDPQLVVRMIQDHAHGMEALYSVISGERKLTTSYLKELHQVITAHQSHCEAVDTLGRRTQVELRRGKWKTQPNNIDFGDGSTFEFCPPEQVASEIDRLLEWHQEHLCEKVPPEIEAAWLHHRFTLIHPFQDGNGRIARCLATLVMLQENWLPPVVTRDDRGDYLLALRAADDGDLGPLVEFFGAIERRAIRDAFSLSSEVLRDTDQVLEIMDSAKRRLAARRESDEKRRKALVQVCDTLHHLAETEVTETLKAVSKAVKDKVLENGPSFTAYLAYGRKDDGVKAKYYYGQIINCAKQLRYRVNPEVYQSWVALVIDMTPYPKTEILFSFHGMGAEARGIIGCSAMTYQKHAVYAEDGTKETRFDEVEPLSKKPFEFTYLDEPKSVERNFLQWLKRCLRDGLARWSQNL